MKPGEVKWAWATDDRAEYWNGCFDTRDEAIKEALQETHLDQDVWVDSGTVIDAGKMIDFDEVVENIQDCNGEPPLDRECFDVGEGAEEALVEWARKYFEPTAFAMSGDPELVRARVPDLSQRRSGS